MLEGRHPRILLERNIHIVRMLRRAEILTNIEIGCGNFHCIVGTDYSTGSEPNTALRLNVDPTLEIDIAAIRNRSGATDIFSAEAQRSERAVGEAVDREKSGAAVAVAIFIS